MTAEELVEKLREFDPWTRCYKGECDPNPADAFDQGVRYMFEEAERLLKE